MFRLYSPGTKLRHRAFQRFTFGSIFLAHAPSEKPVLHFLDRPVTRGQILEDPGSS